MVTQHSVAVSRRSLISLALFSVSLFLSSALLFLLEPMFAKIILPLMGGTTAVWTICMLFYQAMLLAGYAYANAVTRRATPRLQVLLFVGLTLAPLLILPFGIPPGCVPPASHNPVPWLLLILTLIVGLPCFILSTVTPTLQKWFAATDHPLSGDPYFLYAASNAGSMLGLLSYPVLIEPHLLLTLQSRYWAWAYALLVALLAACSGLLWRTSRSVESPKSTPTNLNQDLGVPTLSERLLWIALAFAPCSLMLGVTTVLTTEISPIPLFWVVPLAVYLLSFILVFARKQFVPPSQMAERMPFFILAALTPVILKADLPLFLEIAVNLMLLFVVSIACHGELAKRRPSAGYLTGFYLYVALGGVLGGVFNALIAPAIFSTILEFPLALIFAALLRQQMIPESKRPQFTWHDAAFACAIAVLAIAPVVILQEFGLRPGITLDVLGVLAFTPCLLICLSFAKRPIRFALGIGALVLAGMFYTGVYQSVLRVERSFYGVYRIANDASGKYRILFDGRTIHGMQSLVPSRNREPLSYFARSGPIGQVFESFSESPKLKSVAIVGLGAGTMACYEKPGQDFTFYEIDPLVERIARDPRYFTFLQNCAPSVRVVLGDARISLKNASDHQYGMIILDAFGADAIPVHLLTREALSLYLTKLAPYGVIVFHISNRYVNLTSVLANIAGDAALVTVAENDTTVDIQAGKLPSLWVAMARREEDLGSLVRDPRWIQLKSDPSARVWTDDFSSILTVFRWE